MQLSALKSLSILVLIRTPFCDTLFITEKERWLQTGGNRRPRGEEEQEGQKK